MSKKKVAQIKINLPAGEAKPSPPVGPAIGSKGLNIMGFCKQFNEESLKAGFKPGTVIRVLVDVFEDKTFALTLKNPPVSSLVKEKAGIKKGSSATKKDAHCGEITFEQCREIAKIKLAELNTDDVEAGAKSVAGSALSMGLRVIM